MKLDIFRTLWGYTGDWKVAINELRAAGFDGIEARLPVTPDARLKAAEILKGEGVPYIGILFTAYDVLPHQAATPVQHLKDFKQKLAWADDLQPRFLNVLAGNDRWPIAQQVEFFGRDLREIDASLTGTPARGRRRHHATVVLFAGRSGLRWRGRRRRHRGLFRPAQPHGPPAAAGLSELHGLPHGPPGR